MSAETVATIVTALITGAFGYGIASRTGKSNRAVGMTPAYEALDNRNARLEERLDRQGERIDDLERALHDTQEDRDNFAEAFEGLRIFMRQIVVWIKEGAEPPPPTMPASVRDQIGEDFEYAHITELSRTTTHTQTERIVYPEEQP